MPAVNLGYMLTDGHEALAGVAAAFPTVRFIRIDDDDALGRHAPELEVLLTVGFRYTASAAKILRDGAPALKWIQWANAGIDTLLRHGIPPGVAVTYAPTVWGPTVAEHAVAMLLGLARRFPDLERDRAAAAWNRADRAAAMVSLDGMLVLCLGFGAIGRSAAQRLRPFGARIVAFARSARQDPDAEAILGLDRLDDFLPQADAVVIALPSAPGCRGLLDRRRLASMKPSAILINVARGDIVDEDALADALSAGRLSGAGLDVFSTEPLPSDRRLWRAPNTILSPHLGGYGGKAYERLADLLRTNLERYLSGRTLLHPIVREDDAPPAM